jgi:hypothetical protein
MTKSESITRLAAALALAQAEMPIAVFDATNPFLKSKYASLGSVIQASRPILAKHKLSLVQFPISDASGIGVESVLSHESGEFVSERILIPLTEELIRNCFLTVHCTERCAGESFRLVCTQAVSVSG